MLIAALLASPIKSRRPVADCPAEENISHAGSSMVPSAPGAPPREIVSGSSPGVAMQAGSGAQVSVASLPSAAGAALEVSEREQHRRRQPPFVRQAGAQCPGPEGQHAQAQPPQAPHAPAESAGGDAAQKAAQPALQMAPREGAPSPCGVAEGVVCGTPAAELEAGLHRAAGPLLGSQGRGQGRGGAREALLTTLAGRAGRAAAAQPCGPQEGQRHAGTL